MPFVTRKSLLGLGLLGVAGAVVAGGFVWSGIYNIGADDAHTRPVYALLETLRDRSIQHRAQSIDVPDLSDPALIRQGAGNYDAMCTGCHLAPGMAETELSKGLYPAPPAFARAQVSDPAHHFWVIKHGIKASGMPAWGKSMKDEYIWGMVAFLQQLPTLDEAHYKALVASSAGHSHGGGESGEHPHHDSGGNEGDHGKAGEGHMNAESDSGSGKTHVHADGTEHVHEPEPADTTPSGETAVEPEQHEHHH